MTACLCREAGATGLIPMTRTISDSPTAPLLQADGNRRSALLVNADASNSFHVVLGRGGSVGDSSYECKPGEGFPTTMQGEVWVKASPGLSVVVKVLIETGEGS